MRPSRCALRPHASGGGRLIGGAGDYAGCISWRSLTRTCSSGHDHRMPVPLFAHKPGRCPYGHSLAPGMPQKISWMPCICEPAREAERQGRGTGHLNAVVRDVQRRGLPGHPGLRAAAPSRLQRSGQRVDDATGRFSASETTARATATAAGWSAARTVTMLMIWLAVCALTMLTALADAARSAAAANSAGPGWSPRPCRR